MLAAHSTPMPAWQLNPLVDLHWRLWGTDCLVFEATSGTTSAVDPLDAAVMSFFDEGPRSLDDLVSQVAGDLGATVDSGVEELVRGVVEQFLARGWLQPINSAG